MARVVAPMWRSPVTSCARCGRAILSVVTDDGQRLALDQAPRTYLLRVDERVDGLPVVDRSRAYVAHASVCQGSLGHGC